MSFLPHRRRRDRQDRRCPRLLQLLTLPHVLLRRRKRDGLRSPGRSWPCPRRCRPSTCRCRCPSRCLSDEGAIGAGCDCRCRRSCLPPCRQQRRHQRQRDQHLQSRKAGESDSNHQRRRLEPPPPPRLRSPRQPHQRRAPRCPPRLLLQPRAGRGALFVAVEDGIGRRFHLPPRRRRRGRGRPRRSYRCPASCRLV